MISDWALQPLPMFCPGSGWQGRKRFLPFEGDTLLAIILSKAFLLANDQAIKDEKILRQIRGV